MIQSSPNHHHHKEHYHHDHYNQVEVCGPGPCPLVRGETLCRRESKAVIQQVHRHRQNHNNHHNDHCHRHRQHQHHDHYNYHHNYHGDAIQMYLIHFDQRYLRKNVPLV